jgi:hypothetical protein
MDFDTLKDTSFNCLPTMIGSLPHINPAEATSMTFSYLKDVPVWPQLTKRDYRELMYPQFAEGFPGISISNERIIVDRSKLADGPLEKLYEDYLAGKYDRYSISREFASGLHHLLSLNKHFPFIKGQVTGPITWGLTVTDETRRAILFDEMLGDAVPKFLKLKAMWEENALRKLSTNTIIFLDEPYLASFGSATMPLSAERAISLLNEVFTGIKGLKGIHCCGNTDWPVLVKSDTDIISFDTYNYAQAFALFPKEITSFLQKGGAIAWGIVPNTPEALEKETAGSLIDRLEEAITPFTRDNISFRGIIQHSLLTPSCGLAGLSVVTAEKTLSLLGELSSLIRQRYIN